MEERCDKEAVANMYCAPGETDLRLLWFFFCARMIHEEAHFLHVTAKRFMKG